MRNLSSSGLSMSQAQSISNLCNQVAIGIEAQLNSINNASRTITYDGKVLEETVGVPMPEDIVKLLTYKGKLHATQAFLMEAIRSKDAKIQSLRLERPSPLPHPEPINIADQPEAIPSVSESWGWDQLTDSEINEFRDVEAMAAHIGQFIHKGSKLDSLRRELDVLKAVDWIELETGKKTPIIIHKHHSPKDLMDVHTTLADMHREYEQRVNYFKAKVKNLVTLENARIARANADAMAEWDAKRLEVQNAFSAEYTAWVQASKTAAQEFEEQRQLKIKEIAAMRIKVDPRFQEIIDEMMPKSKE